MFSNFYKYITILLLGHMDNGTCYDPDLQFYTCPNCKIFKTNRNVLFFMYHLKTCKIDAQVRIITTANDKTTKKPTPTIIFSFSTLNEFVS